MGSTFFCFCVLDVMFSQFISHIQGTEKRMQNLQIFFFLVEHSSWMHCVSGFSVLGWATITPVWIKCCEWRQSYVLTVCFFGWSKTRSMWRQIGARRSCKLAFCGVWRLDNAIIAMECEVQKCAVVIFWLLLNCSNKPVGQTKRTTSDDEWHFAQDHCCVQSSLSFSFLGNLAAKLDFSVHILTWSWIEFVSS